MTRGERRPGRSSWSVRIASVRGIPIEIHASFLLLVVFMGWRTTTSAGLAAAAAEQVLVLAVFVCVALHELGHAIVARRNGVPIAGITLYPFGGVARMARRPPQGMVEVVIAAAGPLVNLAIAATILVVSGGAAAGMSGGLWSRLVGMLLWANLILAFFNLLPAFPLDGGRILRGLLTLRLGWIRATVWAGSIGQVAAALLLLLGVIFDPWLILAGILILPAANAELRYALLLRQLAGRRVGDLVRGELITVDGAATISEVSELSVASPLADFLVSDRGRVVGYLSAPRLWSVLRSDRPATARVAAIVDELARPIPATAPVEDAIGLFDPAGPEVAPVVEVDGSIVGVVAIGDLLRAVQIARRATAADAPSAADDSP
ncbi:MAG: site-2 protease family protein [Thermoanaerobaculales bacterium]|nr:site-2 protease family protein [Thermoanaerobaculales bacterium]